MAKITATGTHAGFPVTVVCEDNGNELFLTFNGESNNLYEAFFRSSLDEHHSIAGSFVPDSNSMLNALNVCRNYFFDDSPTITVGGDIGELPFEENIIY